MLGYTRNRFCRFKELYETCGEEVLKKMLRRRPNIRNRVALEIEDAIVALGIEKPVWGRSGSPKSWRNRELPPLSICSALSGVIATSVYVLWVTA